MNIDKIMITAAPIAPQIRVRGTKTNTASATFIRLAEVLTQSGIGLAVLGLPDPKAHSTWAADVARAKAQ